MKRLRAALQLNNSHCVAKQLGLFLTQTFFLWMFFTAGSLERLAELDLISGPPGADVKHLTFAFAARWRHGMTGGWPLYMPGFFVTAVAVWFWVYGLTWRKIIAEYAVMMGLAVVVALLFLPASHSFIVAAFQQQTGLQCEAEGLTVAARDWARAFHAHQLEFVRWGLSILSRAKIVSSALASGGLELGARPHSPLHGG